MICLECAHIDLGKNPKHARVGFGHCKHEPMPGVFESIVKQRECSKFTAADAATVAERAEWWAKTTIVNLGE